MIDYTQLELCMAAHAAHTVLDTHGDLHTQVASEIFGVPMVEVTPAQRRLAKEHNFAACYGGGYRPAPQPITFFAQTDLQGGRKTESPLVARNFLTQAEAARVAQHYFERHPHMREWFAKHPPGQPIR